MFQCLECSAGFGKPEIVNDIEYCPFCGCRYIHDIAADIAEWDMKVDTKEAE